jgi:hypothetical protein
MKINSPGKAKAVGEVPEYLIAALAATVASAFAKQLGNILERIRTSKASEKNAGASPPAPGKLDDTRVELRLKQGDGSYQVAAEGTVDSAVVNNIIAEIGDS